jgi:ribosomal protein L40E
MEYSDEDIRKKLLSRPHVVILGAGATMACIPNGDKYGRMCSVMDGFIEKMGLKPILDNISLRTTSKNLESIYSELDSRPECADVKEKLEQCIINQLSMLELPDCPTIYDYLLLSLREKDYIFSFNWDALLIKAYNRVWNITHNLPHLAFLHGNVGVGMCMECGSVESLQHYHCRKCGSLLERPKILFPVKKKDYHSDLYIKEVWEAFLEVLGEATILTIFGYGAPSTDVSAVKAMEKAFSAKFRRLDQIEIIDIKDENELRNTWNGFIEPTNFHCNVHSTLFEGFIGEFPRRSIEGYVLRNYKFWFGRSQLSLKPCQTFDELRDLMLPLIEAEREGNNEVFDGYYNKISDWV